MPAERVPMRYVREILRLKAEGLSDRSIARSTRLAVSVRRRPLLWYRQFAGALSAASMSRMFQGRSSATRLTG